MSHNRVGEFEVNYQGCEMKVIEYNKYDDIIIEFQDEHKAMVHTQYGHFKHGRVKNPYYPSVFGTAYIGVGEYKSKENDKYTKCYKQWVGMLRRCYDEKFKEKHPTYRYCSVCEEWLNFQNFAKWFYENYYEVEDEVMCLDKDILVKGNKIYSPSTCIFVPQEINKLFTKRDNDRGDLPIGVCYDKYSNKYQVRCSIKGKNKTIGRHVSVDYAFQMYKVAKENEIKRVAEEYKSTIPIELYNAMMSYEVEIDD